jgi:murein DD-endopeptidase MepM/ murein hydrolase activator NlpD
MVRPLVRAAAISALLAAISSMVPDPPAKVVAPLHAPAVASGLQAVCGLRAIPEGEVCVPLPGKNQPIGPAEAARTPPSARDDTAAVFLPRRPDRPAEHGAYALPFESAAPLRVLSDGAGETRAPGERSGVDLAAMRGDKVMLAGLDGQEGEARVVFVGEDIGVTVATLHTVREGDVPRTYVMIYGHLDRPGPGIVPGTRVKPGDVVGFAGDSGSKGVEQLYLEARQVRDGALARLLSDDTVIAKARLADDALSIATDVRNVLAKKQ